MPQPDAAALAAAAHTLGVQPSAEQSATLIAYLAMLAKWNRVYNLTAVRDPSAMLVQHLLDSMAVVAPLRRWTDAAAARLLDVGSGAGLPGVVLAALMPELDVTCVEAVGKKAAFVRQVAGELALQNLHSVHKRVEDLRGNTFEIITSRAFGSLANFVSVTRHLHESQSVWMAMKGKIPADEIGALPESIEVFHVEQLNIPGMAAERCLIWMRERP